MPKNFFSLLQQDQIIEAIRQAEKNTSGEIRLHIDKECKGDVLDQAAFWFEKLQMHKTELRNGVLFYLSVNDKRFAILGDVGINQKVPDGFWNLIKDNIIKNFREGRFTEGLCEGIIESGKQLKQHFPLQTDDLNELSDDISFGTSAE